MTEILIIIALSMIIFGYLTYKAISNFFMAPFYYRKLDWFQQNPAEKSDIVFLGDSLTDWGLWSEIFPAYPVKNRGIGNDRVKGVYQRLDNVVVGQPAMIFLLVGTNDLPHLRFHDNEYILNYYRLIRDKVRAESPETKLIIQSIFPRQRIFAKRIRRLNQELKRFCELEGLEFIDIFPLLADQNGELRKELTNDKLHLMAEGYQIWADAVRPYLPNAKDKLSSS